MLPRINGGLNWIIVALGGFKVIRYISLLIMLAKLFKELAIISGNGSEVIGRVLGMDTLRYIVKI